MLVLVIPYQLSTIQSERGLTWTWAGDAALGFGTSACACAAAGDVSALPGSSASSCDLSAAGLDVCAAVCLPLGTYFTGAGGSSVDSSFFALPAFAGFCGEGAGLPGCFLGFGEAESAGAGAGAAPASTTPGMSVRRCPRPRARVAGAGAAAPGTASSSRPAAGSLPSISAVLRCSQWRNQAAAVSDHAARHKRLLAVLCDRLALSTCRHSAC